MSKKDIKLDDFFSDFQDDLGDLYDGALEPSKEEQEVQKIIDQLLEKRYQGEVFLAEGGMKGRLLSSTSWPCDSKYHSL